METETTLLDDAADKFGTDVVDNFWILVDSLNWSVTSSKRDDLLRDLSPQQSKKYRELLLFLSENLASKMKNYDPETFLAATLACANEIGINGEEAVWHLLKEREINVLELDDDIDNSFLYDFPTDDDYWN